MACSMVAMQQNQFTSSLSLLRSSISSDFSGIRLGHSVQVQNPSAFVKGCRNRRSFSPVVNKNINLISVSCSVSSDDHNQFKRNAVQAKGALQVTTSCKKILIMGGTRFIGIFLSRLLIKEGHQVTLFTRGKALIAQQLPGESDADFADFSSTILHLKGDRQDFDFVKTSQSAGCRPRCDREMMYIQSTCATSGEGLYEGLAWLSNNIASKSSLLQKDGPNSSAQCRNVASLLKPGGYFFGITPDSSMIRAKYRKTVDACHNRSASMKPNSMPNCIRSERYMIIFEDEEEKYLRVHVLIV